MPDGNMVRHHREVLSRFVEAAEEAAVVSFDLFDTLLVRCFGRPSDLFVVLGRQLAAKYPGLGETFASERVNAEVRARTQARKTGRSEISLADIYAELKVLWHDRDGIDLNELMNAECSLEMASVAVDHQVKQVFDDLSATKTCVIVSDMYLPFSCIRAMLERAGIDNDTKVFLSNDRNATKHDGTIWEVVRDDLFLGKGGRIIHLDDNPVVDNRTAKLENVRVFLLSAPNARRTAFRETPWGSGWFHDACHALLQQSLVRHRDDDTVDPYWLAVGHLVAVPVVLGLAGYVKQVAEQRGTDKVFFLARDGLIVQKAFEAAWRGQGERSSQYIWASRRCLNVAMLDEVTDLDLDFLTSGIASMSVANYLHRVDLDLTNPRILDVVGRYFQDVHAEINLKNDHKRLRAMFLDLTDDLRNRAKVERVALLKHLDQVGLFSGPGVVVDLGWHGTLQRSLITMGRQATGEAVDLTGVYLGMLKPRITEAAGAPMRAYGWLFDDDGPVAAKAVIESSIEVIELLFSAPEGGIRYVEMVDGQVRPVRITEAQEAPRLKIASLVHSVVEQSCSALRPLIGALTPDELKAAAIGSLNSLLSSPTRRDVEVFRQISHAEGFGVARYKPIIPTVPERSSRWAIYNAYNDAFWKAGFVTGLNPRNKFLLNLVQKEKKIRSFISYKE